MKWATLWKKAAKRWYRFAIERGKHIRWRAKEMNKLAAMKQGEFECVVCGLPCYESDQTPAGYLCSRCCPHPAEEENAVLRDFLRAASYDSARLVTVTEERDAFAQSLWELSQQAEEALEYNASFLDGARSALRQAEEENKEMRKKLATLPELLEAVEDIHNIVGPPWLLTRIKRVIRAAEKLK